MGDFFENQPVIISFVLGVFFVLGMFTLGHFFYSIKSLDDIILVSGTAQKTVTSDRAVLTLSLEKTVSYDDIKEGYTLLSKKAEEINQLLLENKVATEDIIISAPFSVEFSSSSKSSPQYKISQTIQIISEDVFLLNNLSKNLPEQSSSQVLIVLSPIQFFYSQLPELRVKLVEQAIEDAKGRATNLVSVAGSRLGKLKTAAEEIVQVTPSGTLNTEKLETYDTSSIEKDVIVTVNTSFSVQ